MPKRLLYLLAVLLVTLFSCGLRLYAAQRLNVDYDEPVYLGDAVAYASYMRAGDYKMLAWSEHTYEHPALYKILYGVVLLTQQPLGRLPDKDLPRLAPIAATAAGPWNLVERNLSVFFGTLAVLFLALINPLAGLFLGISTLSVKYTSEVYLEALPLFSSLLCALTYLRWMDAVSSKPLPNFRRSMFFGANGGGWEGVAPRWRPLWLALSAVFLGMTAASKYIYSIVSIAICIHFFLAVYQKQIPRRLIAYFAGWVVLSAIMFFVFDPYLWPHPFARIARSIAFHESFQDSRLVLQYHYPFWQPLEWLSAFSAHYNLGPASAFLIDVDTLIFILAVIGLPGLFQKQRLFFYWLAIGLAFLLIWNTKWPQYTLIILAPFSLAAAQGVITLWNLAGKSLNTKDTKYTKG